MLRNLYRSGKRSKRNNSAACSMCVADLFCSNLVFSFAPVADRLNGLLLCFIIMFVMFIQSTLVISNSLISNNRLSRSETGPCFHTEIYQQNIVEKRRNCSLGAIYPLFPQYFQYISNLEVKSKIHSVKGGCLINCFPQVRKSDMSKYGYLEVFLRVLCFRDNESRLYLY